MSLASRRRPPILPCRATRTTAGLGYSDATQHPASPTSSNNAHWNNTGAKYSRDQKINQWLHNLLVEYSTMK